MHKRTIEAAGAARLFITMLYCHVAKLTGTGTALAHGLSCDYDPARMSHDHMGSMIHKQAPLMIYDHMPVVAEGYTPAEDAPT